MSKIHKCQLCGEPMPLDEAVFKFHGYSGPCPKPPTPAPTAPEPMSVDEGQDAFVKLIISALSVDALREADEKHPEGMGDKVRAILKAVAAGGGPKCEGHGCQQSASWCADCRIRQAP